MSLKLKSILKMKLKEAEVKIPTLSKRTGISRQTLANWASGQRPRNIEQVKLVADFFGITVDELCFGRKPLSDVAAPKTEDSFEEIEAGVFEVILRRPAKAAAKN